MSDETDDTTPAFDGDISQYQTPIWWMLMLGKAMTDRRVGRLNRRRFNRKLAQPNRVRPGLELLHDYLIGDPPLIGYAEGWGEHFRQISRLGRLNVSELIINAKSARMSLRGFRTAAANDDLGDQVARSIMRANNYAVVAREIHDFQLWAADGYGMATPPQGGDKYPTLTSEDPRQTITAHDPATGRTLAGLKLFRDEWDRADIAHLYIRLDNGKTRHFPLIKTGVSSIVGTSFNYAPGQWDLSAPTVDLPRMPLVNFKNRGHRGEYERHLDSLDRINDQIMDKVVIAKVQAFRQMILKGLPDSEVVVGPDGVAEQVKIDYSDAFVAEPGSLWKMPAGVDIYETQTTDIGPLRLAIKDDLQHLAAVTQTSLPAITPDAAQGSAEGANLMREEEVFAVEACRDYASGGHAELMATAFAFMEDSDRGDVGQIEPMWGPIERFSLTERASAAAQAATSLPREAIQTDIWQYDAADIPRLRELAGRDLLSAPTPAAPAAPANGVPPVKFVEPGVPGAPPAAP